MKTRKIKAERSKRSTAADTRTREHLLVIASLGTNDKIQPAVAQSRFELKNFDSAFF